MWGFQSEDTGLPLYMSRLYRCHVYMPLYMPRQGSCGVQVILYAGAVHLAVEIGHHLYDMLVENPSPGNTLVTTHSLDIIHHNYCLRVNE